MRLLSEIAILSSSMTSCTRPGACGSVCSSGRAPKVSPEEPGLKFFKSTSPSEMTLGSELSHATKLVQLLLGGLQLRFESLVLIRIFAVCCLRC